MANHAKVAQVLQYAVEVTEGTTLAATKKFPSLMIEFNPEVTFNKYRPSGSKWTTVVIKGKDYTVGPLSGPITFGELPILLSSIVNYVLPVTALGITTWINAPSLAAQDTSKSFTFEWGDATAGFEVSGTYLNELTLTFNREKAELSGSWVGRKTLVGQAITNALPYIENVPVSPAGINVYHGTSMANVVTGTKLTSANTEAFEAVFKLGKRFAPYWPLDSSLPSFGGRVEDVPEATFSLKLKADVSGSDWVAPVTVAKMDAGTTCWFRVECIGPVLGASTYLMNLIVAVKVIKAYKFTDIDGALLGLTWDFEIVDDGTAAFPFQFTTQNATTGL